MRARIILPWVAVAAIALVGANGWRERAAAAALQERFDALGQRQRELAGLETERERLRQELTEALARLPEAPVATSAATEGVAVAAPVWEAGEWTSATTWSNEGRMTPGAAVGTLLWAAAGGDLAAMRGLLQLDEAARAKARAWFESLPPAGRALYATPEDLVAGATLYSVPPTRAQLSWSHQTDADHAIVGMMLANPSPTTPRPPLSVEPAAGGRPPEFKGDRPYQVVVLDLQRTADGWRVNVPVTAIDSLAQRLRAPGKE